MTVETGEGEHQVSRRETNKINLFYPNEDSESSGVGGTRHIWPCRVRGACRSGRLIAAGQGKGKDQL